MTVARHGILLRRLLAGAFLFIVIYYDLSTAAAKGRQQVFATLAIINHVLLFIVLHALHGFFNAHHNKVSSSLQLRFIFPFFFLLFSTPQTHQLYRHPPLSKPFNHWSQIQKETSTVRWSRAYALWAPFPAQTQKSPPETDMAVKKNVMLDANTHIDIENQCNTAERFISLCAFSSRGSMLCRRSEKCNVAPRVCTPPFPDAAAGVRVGSVTASIPLSSCL